MKTRGNNNNNSNGNDEISFAFEFEFERVSFARQTTSVAVDECSICGSLIPQLEDDHHLAMTHHMAAAHEVFPTGVKEKTSEYTFPCRRCHAYFRDTFIRDLHETKACSAPECDVSQSLPTSPPEGTPIVNLPNEILRKIFHSLSFQDCRRVCSTSSRLYNLLPLVVSSLDVSSLTVSRKQDLPTVDFLFKHNLSSSVETIKLDTELIDGDFTESLKAVFSACPNLERLYLDNSAGRDKPTIRSIIHLDELLDGKPIREVHCSAAVKQIVIPPESAVKCTVNCETLVEMYFAFEKCLASSCDPTMLDVSSSLKSMTVIYNKGYQLDYYIWDALQCKFFRNLEEVVLIGHTVLPKMGDGHPEPQEKVKRLEIKAPLASFAIRRLLFAIFPNVASLTLKIDGLVDSLHAFNRLTGFPSLFPSSLKELHLVGTFDGQIMIDNYLWKQMFESLGQDPRPNLEVITQKYEFVSEFIKTVAPKLSPAFVNKFNQLNPGLFRDLYFHLDRLGDWDSLVSLLRNCASLDHLYIHNWFRDETEANRVTVASPPIATKIARLTVDDNHFHYEASFKILSSFPNVDELCINCDVNSQMFRACQDWARETSATWRLDLIWEKGVNFDVLRGFPSVTHLTIDNQSGVPIDLEQLRVVVSSKLRYLRITGHCIQPDRFDQCLRFPSLEEFHAFYREADSREAFLRKLSDHLWPKKLRKIVLEPQFNRTSITKVDKTDLHLRIRVQGHEGRVYLVPSYLVS